MVTSSLVLFYVAGALTLGGALGVVMTRNIVYAALALLVALVGVAGIFLLAYAEFLALVQVLIYGGAVVIVFLFALMLTRIEDFAHLSDNRQWPIAAVIAHGRVWPSGCRRSRYQRPDNQQGGRRVRDPGRHPVRPMGRSL